MVWLELTGHEEAECLPNSTLMSENETENIPALFEKSV